MWRILYSHSINPETFLSNEDIRSFMASLIPAPPSSLDASEDLPSYLARWQDEQSLVFQELFARAGRYGTQQPLVKAILVQSTPMASVLGAWLQGMSAPGVFEDEVQLKTMALLADDIGVGQPRSSRFDEFKLLLKQNNLPEYLCAPHELAALRTIEDGMFALPAVLTALSRRSDAFAPEICGIDLFLRTMGVYPCWAILKEHAEGIIRWERLNLQKPNSGLGIDGLATAQGIAAAYDKLGPEITARVKAGAAWIAQALDSWNACLLAKCEEALNPHLAMAALIRERAREGAVYHQDFMMSGKSLSLWLEESVRDPMPFLGELAKSPLIKPGNSAKSILVNNLINMPKSPMFRVFSKDDVEIIRRWIDWLPKRSTLEERAPTATEIRAPSYIPEKSSPNIGAAPAHIREAYFLLQGRALPPALRDFAVQYVKKRLVQSQHSLKNNQDRSLPESWTPHGLREWLITQHDKQGSEFEAARSSDLPSKEDVIDSTLQLAPLTLIDGAWLQGFTDIHLASSRIGSALFETYWDELGNGEYKLNHPKIYRDVLRQMGLELPPTGSRAFADDRRFRDESFVTPVYWLCLGKLPNTFMPEILGMNLAMELSGVGGSYRSAQRFMKHYGFSTQFVDIHNTIDNISTGHSAWAVDAINAYMQKASTLEDKQNFADIWKRVRVGYESLAPSRNWLSRLLRRRLPFGIKFKKIKTEKPALFHHLTVSAGI